MEGLGGLDILVVNAARQQYREDVSEVSTADFDATLKTNLYALHWICQAAMPHLPPGAAIITTASIVAYEPSPLLLDYATTKAGIVAYTKALAKQAIKKGIRANIVAPGPIWTVLQPSGGQPDEKVRKFGENSDFERPGQPVELAPIYVLFRDFFLAMAGGATPKAEEKELYYSDDPATGVPFIRVRNLSTSGELDLGEVKLINAETHNGMLARSHVHEGDLLVKITGVGRMADTGYSYEINAEVLRLIEDSGLLIADLTHGNKNVYQEIGYLMGLNQGKGLAHENFLLVHNASIGDVKRDIGFNIAEIKQLRLSDTNALREAVKEQVSKFYGLG